MAASHVESQGTGGPFIPALTNQQAYTGLRLNENWELADALEIYIRGYIDCARSYVCRIGCIFQASCGTLSHRGCF